MWVIVNITLSVIAQERDRKWRGTEKEEEEEEKKMCVDLSLGG